MLYIVINGCGSFVHLFFLAFLPNTKICRIAGGFCWEIWESNRKLCVQSKFTLDVKSVWSFVTTITQVEILFPLSTYKQV